MDKVFRFFAGGLTIIACAGFAESAQNPKTDCLKAIRELTLNDLFLPE